MPYNSIISRTDAAALIPEEVSREIMQGIPKNSMVMQLGTRLPDLSRKQLRIPVASALPLAYWVDPTDTGVKQTTDMTWDNVYLNAEEIAVIVPISQAVLDDADYDIWTQIKPSIEEAFGKVFDDAVLSGTNAPSTFPSDIKTAANAASQQISLANFADLYDAILSEGGLCDLVEQDGFSVNGFLAVPGVKAKLRGLRDGGGQPIFSSQMQQANQYLLDGSPVYFAENGAVTSADFHMVAGDFRQLVWAMRQDISYKIFDQGIVQDNSGAIVYNLMQQDMVAMRVVMRLGWQVPNPPNRVNTVAATRYPFAVLTA